MYAINNKIFDLSTPKIMGILNVTPDSFFDGGKYVSEKNILTQVEKMLTDGADIIDIGGMSTRPKAELINEEIETERVLNALKFIKKEFPDALISIDTFRSGLARKSIQEGAHIINDISGGNFDAQMFQTVLDTKATYVLMHSRGTFETMMHKTLYENLITDVLDELITKLRFFKENNFNNLIIDIGLGFSKTIEQNFELLRNLPIFKIIEFPLLVGVSRKSMIWRTLNIASTDALNGTTALNFYALQQGAQILRVHDVLEACQTITLFKKIKL